MEQTLEHRIRERAYEIWHANGQADGKAHEHWLAAELEVLSSPSMHALAPVAGALAKPQTRKRASSRTGSQRSSKPARTSAGARAQS
jgi:hypothetical protein